MRRNLTIFGAITFVACLFVALSNAQDTSSNPAEGDAVQTVDPLDILPSNDFILSVPVGSGALESATAEVAAPTDTTSVLVVPAIEQAVAVPVVVAQDEFPLVVDSEAPPEFDASSN